MRFSLIPRWKSFVPFVHVSRHPWTPLPGNMHTEAGNPVLLQVIALGEYRFSAENLPHSIDRNKPTIDLLNINPFPVGSLFIMVIQTGAKIFCFSYVYWRTTLKKNKYT